MYRTVIELRASMISNMTFSFIHRAITTESKIKICKDAMRPSRYSEKILV